MKSFFVIKGEPNRWFDQQGEEIRMIDVKGRQVPYVTSKAESAVNSDFEIDNPDQVSLIHLSFHVKVCKDIHEVMYMAKDQNIF